MTLRHGAARLREDALPNVKNTSFRVTAEVVVDAGASGVLVAQGGRFGGWCIYAVDGVVSFCHNLCGLERYHVRSDRVLTAGTRLVEMAFTYDGGGVGKGGTARLSVDGECVGTGRVERTVPYAFSVDESLTVGFDRGTPVTEEYEAGRRSRFSGTVRWLRIDSLDDGDAAGSEGTWRAAVMTQ